MSKLIVTFGGLATVVPSVREIPRESNKEAQVFARTLCASGFDMVIFLTGVGTRALARVAETVCTRDEYIAALQNVPIIARGPKPFAALKELGVPVTLAVPEPNTWRELLAALDAKSDTLPLRGKRVAVQEYGAPNPELLAGLTERGAQITQVPVYQWALPGDLQPLRNAVVTLANGEVDVALFTTSIQVVHLLKIATEMNLQDELRKAFARILVGSIGPVTSEELREQGIIADYEPSHPKMGFLVTEVAQRGTELLSRKRNAAASNPYSSDRQGPTAGGIVR